MNAVLEANVCFGLVAVVQTNSSPMAGLGPAEDLPVLGSPICRPGLRAYWRYYGCWIFSTNPPLTVMTPSAGIVHTP